ncbi:hypothetical protein MGYG_09110 [Nannizzia gypsea CBS 118893]|uniref:Uncharacterized protein n=1 Tax=Arthroderma gypseum (strain ATCC MYA-4604 / CBS 118893) TaxID=535722 RepID=E4V0D6_ARTGP|nr:hypothetical protein MGYG_09110 [Nannizzia gypsea CBS 118893]EFR03073.1 hypothetical protein MGYG_09110 [Nannizzia gypsea CBS 118893]
MGTEMKKREAYKQQEPGKTKTIVRRRKKKREKEEKRRRKGRRRRIKIRRRGGRKRRDREIDREKQGTTKPPRKGKEKGWRDKGSKLEMPRTRDATVPELLIGPGECDGDAGDGSEIDGAERARNDYKADEGEDQKKDEEREREREEEKEKR